MKIGFISLGCCKNLVDSEQMMGLLKASGHQIVSDPKIAEAIIINTCGFITSAKEEAINTILEMAEYKELNCKKLIVTGCLPQRYKKELIEEIPEVDRFISIDEYPHLGQILSEVLNEKVNSEYGKEDRVLSSYPWMAYLKIADGCDNRCSYCAIPLIRGNYRSVPMEDLVDQAKLLAQRGVKELVLIAQDTTRYGTDNYGERRLLDLLKEINQIEGIHWIRILYMYPDEIDDELVIGMKALDKVLPYFDIPVQHGNDKMLLLMNRRGTKSDILRTISLIKDHYEMPVLRTTMIVGFPHETEEDFNEMLEFVKLVRWDRLGAFTYSLEEGTKGYEMDEQVDEDIKDKRLRTLMTLQEKIAQENSEKLIGKTLEVLVEKHDSLTHQYKGRSIFSAPDGVDGEVIFYSTENISCGSFVQVKIKSAYSHDLVGDFVGF